jgi:hypothetical protein
MIDRYFVEWVIMKDIFRAIIAWSVCLAVFVSFWIVVYFLSVNPLLLICGGVVLFAYHKGKNRA